MIKLSWVFHQYFFAKFYGQRMKEEKKKVAHPPLPIKIPKHYQCQCVTYQQNVFFFSCYKTIIFFFFFF